MKLFFLLPFLFFSAFADAPQEFQKPARDKISKDTSVPSKNDCSMQAENHGGTRKVQTNCFKSILEKSTHANRASQENNKILAVAAENIIFIKSKTTKIVNSIDKKRNVKIKPRIYTIAGSKTKLNQVISLSIAPNAEKIAALNINKNNEREILIFPTFRSGNFSALKKISLQGIISEPIIIHYHFEKEEIYILDSATKKIFIISSLTDSRHHDPNIHPHILKTLAFQNINLKTPISFVLQEKYIIWGDKSSNTAYVMDVNCEGTCPLIQKISDDIFTSCDLMAVDYHDNDLILTNACHEEILLKMQ